jgi:hypothetical protein
MESTTARENLQRNRNCSSSTSKLAIHFIVVALKKIEDVAKTLKNPAFLNSSNH